MPSDHLTEQEEAALGAATLAAAAMLDSEEVVRRLSRYDTYRAIAAVLLDEPGSPSSLLYLRGVGRIGVDILAEGIGFDDEDAANTHRRVMTVLERAGVEPMTRAEFGLELKAAAQSITFRQDAGPTTVD